MTGMSLTRSSAACVALLLAAITASPETGSLDSSDPNQDYFITLTGVSLRPGVTVDISLTVFVNEDEVEDDDDDDGDDDEDEKEEKGSKRTILVLHGTAGNAQHLAAFAEELFLDNPLGHEVEQVVSIDLPGHGLSGLPQGGLLFGELSLSDYSTVVQKVLDRLPEHGLRPRSILGYSLGGLVVPLLQQELVNQGTDLRSMYGIRQVVLVTPIPPAGTIWPNSDVNQNLALAVESCFSGPGVPSFCGGAFPDVDGDGDVDWTDYAFIVAPNAIVNDCDPSTTPMGSFGALPAPPPPASGEFITCASLGLGDVFSFTSGAPPYESLHATLEFIGAWGYARPTIASGIFSHPSGTRLGLIAAVNDMTLGIDLGAGLLEPDLMGLYVHLTGDTGLEGHGVVDTAGSPPNGHQAIRFAPRVTLDAMAQTNIKLP